MKIRAGDLVVVISGEDKSSSPRRVVQVVDGGDKLRVEGVHQVKKHVRRGHPKSPQGGQLEIDLPIDSSNVLFYCCLLYTSPSPRDRQKSRMPSSA